MSDHSFTKATTYSSCHQVQEATVILDTLLSNQYCWVGLTECSVLMLELSLKVSKEVSLIYSDNDEADSQKKIAAKKVNQTKKKKVSKDK